VYKFALESKKLIPEPDQAFCDASMKAFGYHPYEIGMLNFALAKTDKRRASHYLIEN
jgi:hypothetical protein